MFSGPSNTNALTGNLNLHNEEGHPMGHTHAGAALHWGPAFEYNAYASTLGGM